MSIKLRSVRKSCKHKEIISDVNLNIADGEFLVIQGKDLKSKSTLLDIIGGIKKASGGTVTISGYDIATMKSKERAEFYRQMIGFISQGFYLQEELNIRDNISLPGIFSNIPKREKISRVNTISKNLGIYEILDKKPKNISNEQKERACVARACFMNPKIIIADNPTKNLGTKNAEIILSLLSNYSKANKATIIISSNDELSKKFATKVVEFSDGKILEEIK